MSNPTLLPKRFTTEPIPYW